MKGLTLGAILASHFLCLDAKGQCRWSDENESYGTIRGAIIKREVISFIDWVWEYEGTGRKPAMLRLKGQSDCATYTSFKGHGIEVRIEPAPFDSSKHKLTYETGGYAALCEIDGRPFFGTDGGMPRKSIKRVAVTIDSASVQIPRSAWDDLYEPFFCGTSSTEGLYWTCHVARSLDRKRVYVHMQNSDGAGGYAVIWIFINGRYVRRVIEG
ncbi:MAG TPA: hypothetical protein PKY96_18340, partial [Flavobacteriales bacterium]|nr:hypothetical protein [Flavobacteriales bacterium]